jgi:hypothetical protein
MKVILLFLFIEQLALTDSHQNWTFVHISQTSNFEVVVVNVKFVFKVFKFRNELSNI